MINKDLLRGRNMSIYYKMLSAIWIVNVAIGDHMFKIFNFINIKLVLYQKVARENSK